MTVIQALAGYCLFVLFMCAVAAVADWRLMRERRRQWRELMDLDRRTWGGR